MYKRQVSIEGPYIQYDSDSGYYYLYVSYGGLERTGGYQIRVFRSEAPDGPYVDMNGAAPSPIAVSYTHLDVYKRQILFCEQHYS